MRTKYLTCSNAIRTACVLHVGIALTSEHYSRLSACQRYGAVCRASVVAVYCYRCILLPLYIATAVHCYRCILLPLYIATAVYCYRCILLPLYNQSFYISIAICYLINFLHGTCAAVYSAFRCAL